MGSVCSFCGKKSDHLKYVYKDEVYCDECATIGIYHDKQFMDEVRSTLKEGHKAIQEDTGISYTEFLEKQLAAAVIRSSRTAVDLFFAINGIEDEIQALGNTLIEETVDRQMDDIFSGIEELQSLSTLIGVTPDDLCTPNFDWEDSGLPYTVYQTDEPEFLEDLAELKCLSCRQSLGDIPHEFCSDPTKDHTDLQEVQAKHFEKCAQCKNGSNWECLAIVREFNNGVLMPGFIKENEEGDYEEWDSLPLWEASE